MHPLLAPSLTITCQRCPVRGLACADCMVTVLLAGSASQPEAHLIAEAPPPAWPLDPEEARAVHLLVRAGLVSETTAGTACARVEGSVADGEGRFGGRAGERAVG